MDRDLSTVKTGHDEAAPDGPASFPGAKREGYHHGDLRHALVRAAEEVIAERGVDGFSLREAARRAGVSAAAPQHHFGDARGLLTAVATLGFEGLSAALAAADEAHPGATARTERLQAQGRAYVAFALSEPARFDVMWRKARIDDRNPAYREAAERAYRLLDEAILGEAAKGVCGPPDPRTIAAWSAVHGFARLALDGAFGPDPKAAADAMLGGMLGRLDL